MAFVEIKFNVTWFCDTQYVSGNIINYILLMYFLHNMYNVYYIYTYIIMQSTAAVKIIQNAKYKKE